MDQRAICGNTNMKTYLKVWLINVYIILYRITYLIEWFIHIANIDFCSHTFLPSKMVSSWILPYSGLLLWGPNFCDSAEMEKFLRLLSLRDTKPIYTGYCAKRMLGPILLTRKYKNFSLPAEIFASLAFIRKFRKNLDLAHITRCTVKCHARFILFLPFLV